VVKDFKIEASLELEPFSELSVMCAAENYAIVEIKGKELPKFVTVRDLHTSETESEPQGLLVLDANGAWLLKGKKVLCYQSARLVYGKSIYESMLKSNSNLNCLVVFNGKYQKNPIKKTFDLSTFGTSTSRLEIAESWEDVKIVSEVFVIQTWRGYAPAILVENKSKEIVHVIVGAKSFSSGLEIIRKSSGQIINENISVRKLGEARTSLYEVIHRKNAS
jgi:hypothetical protein